MRPGVTSTRCVAEKNRPFKSTRATSFSSRTQATPLRRRRRQSPDCLAPASVNAGLMGPAKRSSITSLLDPVALRSRLQRHGIAIVSENREGTELGDLPAAGAIETSDFYPQLKRGLAMGGTIGLIGGLVADLPVASVAAIDKLIEKRYPRARIEGFEPRTPMFPKA